MGHSVTCTFQVNINYKDGSKLSGIQSCYGAMSLKDVRGIMMAEHQYQVKKELGAIGKGLKSAFRSVVSAEIWPQTARGRKMMKGHDYAVLDFHEKMSYHNIS